MVKSLLLLLSFFVIFPENTQS